MIADCVHSHISWMTVNAKCGGGEIGSAGSVPWAFVPADDTLHLLFPATETASDAALVVAKADEVGARSTALWCSEDRLAPGLDGLGFQRAWQPWWMEISPRDVPPTHTARVRLVSQVRPHDELRAGVLTDDDVVLAEGEVDGHYAGRAWMIVTDGVAGMYDLAVWRRFRRQGLGRELVSLLAAEAAGRGARVLTLNATPKGALLYASIGFSMLGGGRTYWRHRPEPSSESAAR